MSANSEEGFTKITLQDIFGAMKHKRDLVLSIIIKPSAGVHLQMLEPSFDDSHMQDMKKNKKDVISLDSCFQAFSREELLTGAD